LAIENEGKLPAEQAAFRKGGDYHFSGHEKELDLMGIAVRKARPEDKADILEISAQIWEGHDYVPQVLDGWLEEGGLWAAELQGKVVGLANTSALSPGELWFEGLRVHPQYRGRGIAKQLARAQLEDALNGRPGSIRMATAEFNHRSIHIATALGFREVARFTCMGGPIGQGPENREVAPPADLDGAVEFIRNSQFLRESQGLLPCGWVFRDFSKHLVEELTERGALLCFERLGKSRGALLLLPALYHDERLDIAFLDGDQGVLSKLIGFARSYGSEAGGEEFRAVVPGERLVRVLEQEGLSFHPDFRYVLVFQYPLR
jgi:ribosomal protein S18 acetylase RimI-like enzyme